MKAVLALALVGAAVAVPAGWQDADPVKVTTTTAASTTWADVSISKTTTTTKPVDPKTWEDVVSSTTADPKTWLDLTSVAPTTTPAVETWVRECKADT